jgi:hypothetical protein
MTSQALKICPLIPEYQKTQLTKKAYIAKWQTLVKEDESF